MVESTERDRASFGLWAPAVSETLIPDDALNEGRNLPTISPLDPGNCIGRTILMPEEADGQHFCAKIIGRMK